MAKVHPRARGEHHSTGLSAFLVSGSSPRTRGTPSRYHSQTYRNSVHPRARGEHGTGRLHATASCGSSPRTRGTRQRRPRQRGALRFIPAHAGNTAARRTTRPSRTVHPRARGEHPYPAGHDVNVIGSSPRTRGTPLRRGHAHLLGRFIPAHAGNTLSISTLRVSPTVHPRARGEHAGIAPRRRQWRRFIPAHAGNTSAQGMEAGSWFGSSPRTRGTPLRPAGQHRDAKVHPRARGEHCRLAPLTMSPSGSSPRTRGTRCQASP